MDTTLTDRARVNPKSTAVTEIDQSTYRSRSFYRPDASCRTGGRIGWRPRRRVSRLLSHGVWIWLFEQGGRLFLKQPEVLRRSNSRSYFNLGETTVELGFVVKFPVVLCLGVPSVKFPSSCTPGAKSDFPFSEACQNVMQLLLPRLCNLSVPGAMSSSF